MRSAHALGPLLLLRGLLADRRRPDLASLGSETDPERFVWRVLPHAARSFAASIVVLRGEQALAAAVAYLYCRMLDTYEDLIDDPAESVVALGRFASRFDSDRLEPPDPIATERARDSSDQLYLLLISRCELVDRVYAGLTPAGPRADTRAGSRHGRRHGPVEGGLRPPGRGAHRRGAARRSTAAA